jgi:uncharacterized protein YegL
MSTAEDPAQVAKGLEALARCALRALEDENIPTSKRADATLIEQVLFPLVNAGTGRWSQRAGKLRTSLEELMSPYSAERRAGLRALYGLDSPNSLKTRMAGSDFFDAKTRHYRYQVAKFQHQMVARAWLEHLGVDAMPPREQVAETSEFVENPEPRCACVLILDTSASMLGEPIATLNRALEAYRDDLRLDALARKRVEVAVVTFGGVVELVNDFVLADIFEPPRLEAFGTTPLGAAVERALDVVEARKLSYRQHGVFYYRPWVFLLTDGAPTDDWTPAAKRVHEAERTDALAFFAVGVQGAAMNVLAKVAVRAPMRLSGLKFDELFVWLSRSQRMVSASGIGEDPPLPDTRDWKQP